MIQMQLQGSKIPNQPIIIQTSATQPVQTQTITQGDQQFATNQVSRLVSLLGFIVWRSMQYPKLALV